MPNENETIKIDNIKILRNIRTEVGDISILMNSIRENGLIEPIIVCKINEEIILVAGNRRYLALKKLGRKELIINKEIIFNEHIKNITDLIIYNAIENLHRKDIIPLEEAKIFSDLREFGLSVGEISARMVVPKSRIISNLKILSSVPEIYRKDISYINRAENKRGHISPTIASAIADAGKRYKLNSENIEELFEVARKEEISTADIRFIGVAVSEGRTLSEAIKLLKDYETKQVDFIVKKDEVKKLKESFSKYLKKVLKDEIKLNKELFY
ncbi:MAG: ParB N-terminal domain-containing protein [Nitrospirae bacterium]|nr:ParB N-terminal domain-containing protein [Nitrospirota bacterium]